MNTSELSKLRYVKRLPNDGRIILLSSFYDNEAREWIFMFEVRPGELGRIANGQPVRAEYFGHVAADPSRDIELPLSTLVVQRLSWPDIVHRLNTVETDIHLFCDILEKFELISERAKWDNLATYLAASELEFLVRVVRSTYDEIQKLIKELAKIIVRPDGTNRPLMKGLPNSFADVALENEEPRSVESLMAKYGMPQRMATFYSNEAPFFKRLRAIRNKLEHHGDTPPIAFALDEGLAVDTTDPAWRDLPIWAGVKLKNEKLGPLRSVFAYLILHVIELLTEFAQVFEGSFGLPEPLGDNIHVYLRNPYGRHLVALRETLKAPWQV